MCRDPDITESIKLCYISQDRKMGGLPSWLPSAMPFFPHLILAYKQASYALWKFPWSNLSYFCPSPGASVCLWCVLVKSKQAQHWFGALLCLVLRYVWAPSPTFLFCKKLSWAAFGRRIRQGNKGKPQQREFFNLGSKDKVFGEVMEHPLIDVGFFMDRYNLMWFWAPKWE